jgi:RNA methyltransferase, TrmH family
VRRTTTLEEVRDADFVVVCVGIQDPGNAGTVVRSTEAFGAGAIICCKDTVDAFSPKCVRASAGSLFRVPVVTGGDPVKVLDRLGGWGLERVGATAHGGTSLDDVDFTGRLALVLGNEARGLPEPVLDRVDRTVTIPLVGQVESLNVGMAAAVLCREVARQRRAGGGAPR